MSTAERTNLRDDPIIGIDLGTTNSLAAYCDERGPRILEGPGGERLLPSVVRLNPQTGRAQAIGGDARRHAVEHPGNTIFSVKRLMGRGLDDVRGELAYLPYEVVEGPHQTARVRVGDQTLSPPQVSAMILRALRDRASAALGTPVRRAVVTVPAYFDDAQRQATRDAGRIAGLDVLRIVNEPTAAALAYGIGVSKSEIRNPKSEMDETVAVFDLGGGTFDISILRLMQTEQGAVDQVLATAGDTHLGGDDVDRMIVELVQREIRDRFGTELSFPPSTRQALRNFSEATKIALSSDERATIEVDLGGPGGGRRYTRTITRDEFDAMIDPWVGRTIESCKAAMRAAGVTAQDIDRVVMVGGSTRVPLVRRRVAELFGRDPYTALNPDEVVALGAAVQASILAGVRRDLLLLDVIPLSLGIETMGGAVAKLITANSTIPARATEVFSTYVDGQTSVKVHVLQGERELVADCRSLGRFDLRGIPPMPAGLPKVEVTFLVDANGILSVTAIERRSEKQASIQIVPNHGLTRSEADRMERDSLEHAKEDMTAHRVIDLCNQARMDLRAIERQLAKVGGEASEDYRREIKDKAAAVKAFLDADPKSVDAEAFHRALDTMDKATVRLAELAIAQTLREES